MKLFTKPIMEKLLKNGQMSSDNPDKNFGYLEPVVKFFTPDGGYTALLTEINPHDPDIAFGLVDCGIGFPELGFVSIKEIEGFRGILGLPIERDRHFTPKKTLRQYADEAYANQHITA